MAMSRLNDPEIAKHVAELWVRGVAPKEIAEIYDITDRTARTWTKDPRVQAHARTLSMERMQRITRRIDSEIEQRLLAVGDMDTELLLKMRREYLERGVKFVQGEDKEAGDATNELAEAMDQDPDFAEQLRALVEGGNQEKK